MIRFAVINQDSIVINLIVAESKEIAEEVTGLICIEEPESGLPPLGAKYIDGLFELPESSDS